MGGPEGGQTWPCTPAFMQTLHHAGVAGGVVQRITTVCWGIVMGVLRSGHVAFLADSSSPPPPFISHACLGKVLSVLCRYKCPFCITPTPAAGSSQFTIGRTFISARTFQKEHALFCTGKSASPTHPRTPRSEAQD